MAPINAPHMLADMILPVQKLTDILAVCPGCSFPPQHDAAYLGAVQYVTVYFFCELDVAVTKGSRADELTG